VRRLRKTILKSIVLVVVAVLFSGIVYEQVGRWKDRKHIPQIGRSVDIGGRTLNIYCLGTGSPTVIFESGGAGPGLGWESIQSEIAKFTQACWYDRAGEGWSDPGPFPRTSAGIAKDLHELLKRAGVPPPYVLTGASFGGLNSRVYNGLYPNEVAGMVLVDSAHEDELQRAPKFYLGRTAPRYFWHSLHIAFQTAAQIGLLRLTTRFSPSDASPRTRKEILRALSHQPKSRAGDAVTGIVLPESYAQAAAVGGLGDRPLIVLAAGKPPAFSDPVWRKQAAAYQEILIHEIQPKLAKLSTRGRLIVIEESGHRVGDQTPQFVVAAVREVVRQVRGEKSSSTGGWLTRPVNMRSLP
jgi:pimeloyl-ACP methyl ester carboxylesterase